MLEYTYNVLATISSNDMEDFSYNSNEISNNFEAIIESEKLDIDYDHICQVIAIGRYRIPSRCEIEYEVESKDIICATCYELDIVHCASNPRDAFNGLESELKTAIELYVHILSITELDDFALQYRTKLSEIEKLNR